MFMPIALTSMLTLSLLSFQGTPPGDWDPTNPEDVAKRATEAKGGHSSSDPLKGPDVPDAAKGQGQGQGGGMQQSATIEGLLQARCGECHGTLKQKGGLQIVPVSRLHEGAEKFRVVKPGDAQGSLLVQRIKLPAGHDDVMPPTGQPLSASEIKIIEAWVNGGATEAQAKKPVVGLASAMGPGAGKGSREKATSPRAFLRAYMALKDLTEPQRKAGIDAATAARTALSDEDKEVIKQFRPLQRANQQGTALPDELGPKQRAIRLKVQAIQVKAREVQNELWSKLNADQKTALKAALDEAAAKASRGRGQNRRPGGQTPPA